MKSKIHEQKKLIKTNLSKKQLFILLSVMITFFSANTFAKDMVTKTSFKVNGNCDMCKKRIEKAAKTEGVKTAVWNVDTHMLTTTFVPGKITVEQIEQNIAKVGYDTEKYKANDAAYKQLPQCCQYER